MPYLIDGHNLIPKIPGLSLQALDDEEQLIKLLQDFCRLEQKDIEVFFDNASAGQSRQQKIGRLTARFIRKGKTADTAIRERLQELGKSAQNWIVVSSDRAVQSSARQARAQVVKSENFARTMSTCSQPREEEPSERTLSKDEIAEWIQIFSEKGKGKTK